MGKELDIFSPVREVISREKEEALRGFRRGPFGLSGIVHGPDASNAKARMKIRRTLAWSAAGLAMVVGAAIVWMVGTSVSRTQPDLSLASLLERSPLYRNPDFRVTGDESGGSGGHALAPWFERTAAFSSRPETGPEETAALPAPQVSSGDVEKKLEAMIQDRIIERLIGQLIEKNKEV